MKTLLLWWLATIALFTSAALAAGEYSINWSTLDAGGSTSSGGGYEVTGTIGQFDASSANQLAEGAYTLTGGFWAITVPACNTFVAPDFDHDCDVDSFDFDRFNACVLGPTVLYGTGGLPAGCDLPAPGGILAADFDEDGDTDGDDFGVFQQCPQRREHSGRADVCELIRCVREGILARAPRCSGLFISR